MIDRTARDSLARALRLFASGRITNRDLEQTFIPTDDTGVLAVYDFAWTLYSDHIRHFARGKHALPSNTKHQIAIVILFLKTDFEYEETSAVSESPLKEAIIHVMSRGKRGRSLFQHERDGMNSRDWSVWPFRDKPQLTACASELAQSRLGLKPG
ncbi:MAG: hypothetical protein CMK07_05365 [Ponticaulis sp.]|nr:hypothetical protein [Ponticaulis sp.]